MRPRMASERRCSVLAGIFGLLLLCGIALYVASESGEIVVLQTRDPDKGGVRKTRLWVVDHEGSLVAARGRPDQRLVPPTSRRSPRSR